MYPCGYYHQNLWQDLEVRNYRRGKIYDYEKNGFDFKYYFDRDRLILVDQYYGKDICGSSFIYYEDDIVDIISYQQDLSVAEAIPNIDRVTQCKYDCLGRISRYITARVSSGVDYFEDFQYSYSEKTMDVKWFNVGRIFDKDKFDVCPKYSTYPIEFASGKPTRKVKTMTDEAIYRMIKNNTEKTIWNWKVRNGYAITVVLDGFSGILIDYAEESDTNSEPHSEERWNYACWDQHPIDIIRDKETDRFRAWVDSSPTGQTPETPPDLIDTPRFLEIFYRVIEEIKSDGVIEKALGKMVPIIITDYEYYDKIVDICKKINEEYLIKDFVSWCDSL